MVKLIGDGLTYSQIAHQLTRSRNTIRTHAHIAYQRLSVPGAAQAVIHCYRAGWLNADDTPALAPPKPRAEDRVTPAQQLYLHAFQRWLRTHDPADRDEMRVLLRIVRRDKPDAATAPSRHEQEAAA